MYGSVQMVQKSFGPSGQCLSVRHRQSKSRLEFPEQKLYGVLYPGSPSMSRVTNPAATQAISAWDLAIKRSRIQYRQRAVPNIFPQGQQSERNAGARENHTTRERRDAGDKPLFFHLSVKLKCSSQAPSICCICYRANLISG